MQIATTVLLVGTLAWVATSAEALTVVGGKGKADCYVGFDVVTEHQATKIKSAPTKPNVVAVVRPACDGQCVFQVKTCVGLAEPAKCTPTALDGVTVAPSGALPIPATSGPENACGDGREFTLEPGTKKKVTLKVAKLVGTTSAAKPRKDSDVLKLTCLKNDANGGCGDGCPETCTNSAGGANQVVLTVGPEGSDLDNGWTGNSHNFPLVPNGKIGLCVDGCDGVSDTSCDVCGRTGLGTISGVTFGPPLPLFASNVPVCVISRWREDIRGTMDEASGATSLNIKLFSDVYLTSRDDVCPQCKNGKCNAASGGNANRDCTVEASLPVYVSSIRTDQYDLSSTCGYTSTPTATLRIDFDPLTSGTTEPLVGPLPCTNQPGEPVGVPEQPDECGASGCGSACGGTACVAMVDDPTNPGGPPVCVDSKGGVSQFCCNNNTAKPCHKLAGGGTVTRTGFGGVPQPPLPDLTYPKTQAGVLVSTFCIPATGTNTIDSVTGLPGPGVIQLPGDAVWTK